MHTRLILTHLLASHFYSILALPSIHVCARMGVAILLCQVWQCYVQNSGVEGSCGLHVEIHRGSTQLNTLHFDVTICWITSTAS